MKKLCKLSCENTDFPISDEEIKKMGYELHSLPRDLGEDDLIIFGTRKRYNIPVVMYADYINVTNEPISIHDELFSIKYAALTLRFIMSNRIKAVLMGSHAFNFGVIAGLRPASDSIYNGEKECTFVTNGDSPNLHLKFTPNGNALYRTNYTRDVRSMAMTVNGNPTVLSFNNQILLIPVRFGPIDNKIIIKEWLKSI